MITLNVPILSAPIAQELVRTGRVHRDDLRLVSCNLRKVNDSDMAGCMTCSLMHSRPWRVKAATGVFAAAACQPDLALWELWYLTMLQNARRQPYRAGVPCLFWITLYVSGERRAADGIDAVRAWGARDAARL